MSWPLVVGRSTAQLRMDAYDMLEILESTAPRALGCPPPPRGKGTTEYEHSPSPQKSWVVHLKMSASPRYRPYTGSSVGSGFLRKGPRLGRERFTEFRSGWNATICRIVLNSVDLVDTYQTAVFSSFSDSVFQCSYPAELCQSDITGACERICAFTGCFAACRKVE